MCVFVCMHIRACVWLTILSMPHPPDMVSFIPEEDRATFEAFLVENNLQAAHKPRPPDTRPHPPASTYLQVQDGVLRDRKSGRSKRHTRASHSSHVADVDKFLQDIDMQMDSILDTTNF